MRGPFWNNNKTGVTGEAPAFVTNDPRYTIVEVDGQRRTYLDVSSIPANATLIEQRMR